MSVVKSKRNQSKIEFEMIFFKIADGVDNMVEHEFYAEGLLAVKNKTFLDIRSRSLEELTDKLLYHIKIANSIYPLCMAEWEERRLKAFRRMVNKGQMTEPEVQNCYQSWRGTTIKDHNAYKKSINKMDRIFNAMFPTNAKRPIKSRRVLAKWINRKAETQDLKLCSLLFV